MSNRKVSARLAEAGASDTTRFFHRNTLASRSYAALPGAPRRVADPDHRFMGMKAVILTAIGGHDVLRVQEWPDPGVGPGDVRIAVRAAGLNFADTMARAGLYPGAQNRLACWATKSPVRSRLSVPTSRAFGSASGSSLPPGSAAKRSWSRSRPAVLPLPENISFEQGAAFCVNYATAYAALIIMGGLRPGNQVLIHAAAGGGNRGHPDRPEYRR